MSAPDYYEIGLGDVIRVRSGTGTQLAWAMGYTRDGAVRVQKYLARSKRFTKPQALHRQAVFTLVAKTQGRWPDLAIAARLVKEARA